MASKGGVGIELELDRVPMRETGMTPYELMLSESQERMLIILKPGREAVAEAIFRKWELDFAVIGHLTDTGRMVLKWQGKVAGDLPIDPLAKASPEYDRPWTPTPKPKPLPADSVPAPNDVAEALKTLIGCPDLASKRWIWEQYDHLVMGDTMQRPGGDAAVVRVQDTPKALALTTDCSPRYCAADPVEGGRQAVAEAWRNLTAVGARPLAITDNMNFGNPERPEIMGQFAALDFPVVSGNVSLYNETNGKGILPTPVIGGVGLLSDLDRMATIALKAPNHSLILIGNPSDPAGGHLGQSLYLREVLGREEGPPPPVDLAAERRNGDFVRAQIAAGRIAACHDLADGGLLVALAEMAAAGGIGAEIAVPNPVRIAHAWLFGEDQGRYLLAAEPAAAGQILAAARDAGVPATAIGRSGGGDLTVRGLATISVAELRRVNEAWLPGYMAAPRGPAFDRSS